MTDPVVDPTTNANPTVTDPTANDPTKDLPEWARKAINDANRDAASYRTKLREAEDKLKNAKTPEEFAAATAALEASNKKLERDLLVAKVAKGDPEKNVPSLPDELAALLQGETEAELKAHADKLRKFVPAVGGAAPPNLSGGLNGNSTGDDGFDPKEIAKRARTGRL